jgi:uncharacterized protein (TIGR03083 family)
VEAALSAKLGGAALGHKEAMTLAETEFDRVLDQLRGLAADDWRQPTACPLWDVRAMAAHILGMAEAQASVRQFAHDFRSARNRSGGKMIDAMTATQVADRTSMTPQEIVGRLHAVAPKAVRARSRVPKLVRHVVRMKQDPPFETERWRFGYLVDKIFTRDTWMHRLDISRATGAPMVLTAAHDGRLVDDVVAEWGQRHGQPFSLALSGPAGGQWQVGDVEERLELDALDFCLTVGSRQPGVGLLSTEVPF